MNECPHGDHEICEDGDCMGGDCDCPGTIDLANANPESWLKYPTKEPSGVYPHAQVEVATRYGLNPGRILWQDAADFYILERLTHDHTREWENRERWPSAWGTDTHLEWEQGRLLAKKDKHWASLIKELSIFLEMACGGELRHAAGLRLWGCDKQSHAHHRGNCEIIEDTCSHVHDSTCCGVNHKHRASCQMRYDDYCMKRYGYVPEYSTPADHSILVTVCKKHKHTQTEACNSDACQHEHGSCSCQLEEHSHSSLCKPHKIDWKGNILEPFMGDMTDRMERHRGWERWMEYRQSHTGPEPLQAMAIAFNTLWSDASSSGGGGVGGPAWGSAAQVVHDWMIGKLSDTSFIDRAWTLEHNNGCMFNKLYPTWKRLRTVLQVQHSRPYDELARFSTIEPLYKNLARLDRYSLPSTALFAPENDRQYHERRKSFVAQA